MAKTKFNIIPPSPQKKIDFVKKVQEKCQEVSEESWNTTWLDKICSHGNFQDIKLILPRNILDNFKDKITLSLLSNLYLSQEIKGRQYTIDKVFAKEIEKYGKIKITKLKPMEKAIHYRYNTSENLGHYELRLDEDISTGNIHTWKIYTQALARLTAYYHGQIKIPIIKESFKSLAGLVKEDSYCTELFFDYADIIQSIDQDTIEKINEHKSTFSTSIILSQNLSVFFLKLGNLQNAKSFAFITDNLLKKVLNNEITLNSFVQKRTSLEEIINKHKWNSAIIMMQEEKYTGAEKLFVELYNVNPNDKDCVELLFSVYQKLGANKKALDLWTKHEDLLPYVSIIRKILLNAQYPKIEDLTEFAYKDTTTIILTALRHAIAFNDTEEIKLYRDIINTKIINNRSSFNELGAIWQITAKLLSSPDNIYDKNIHNHLLKIPNFPRSDLLHEMSLIYANPTTYEVAIKFVEMALQFNPDNCLFLKQKTILQEALRIDREQSLTDKILLSHDTVEEKLPINSTKEKSQKEPSILREVSEKDDLSQSHESYESVIESNDPQKIHQYFQHAKRKMLQQDLNLSKTNAGWLIDENTPIKSSETIKILHSTSATIHPKLTKQHDNDWIAKWEKTLHKGAVGKDGTSGIKLLRNKIYEAKIVSEDDRLISSKTYTNEEGSKLIVFDKECTHNELDRYLVNHQYAEIPCPNYYENDYDILLAGNNHTTSLD